MDSFNVQNNFAMVIKMNADNRFLYCCFSRAVLKRGVNAHIKGEFAHKLVEFAHIVLKNAYKNEKGLHTQSPKIIMLSQKHLVFLLAALSPLRIQRIAYLRIVVWM